MYHTAVGPDQLVVLAPEEGGWLVGWVGRRLVAWLVGCLVGWEAERQGGTGVVWRGEQLDYILGLPVLHLDFNQTAWRWSRHLNNPCSGTAHVATLPELCDTFVLRRVPHHARPAVTRGPCGCHFPRLPVTL